MKIMSIFSKIKNFFIKIYKDNKKLFFVFMALILFVVVGFIFSLKTKLDGSKQKIGADVVSTNTYSKSVEDKIKNILLSMDCVKTVDVFVMVESSPITNYLTQTEVIVVSNQNNSTETRKEEIVLEKNGSISSPVETYVTYPKVSGVLIFLNKIDSSTKLAIKNALSVVLNIDAASISILQNR